jgi:hypothetical protein
LKHIKEVLSFIGKVLSSERGVLLLLKNAGLLWKVHSRQYKGKGYVMCPKIRRKRVERIGIYPLDAFLKGSRHTIPLNGVQ